MRERRPERFWGGVMMLVLSGAMAVALGLLALSDDDLREHGMPATGVIVGRTQTTGRSARSEIAYQYQPDSAGLLVGSAAISAADWERLAVGDTVELRYRAGDPGTHVLVRPSPVSRTGIWWMALALLGIGLLDLRKARHERPRPGPMTVSQASIDYYERTRRR
jgi:Protein of unknown function (DUF3592)